MIYNYYRFYESLFDEDCERIYILENEKSEPKKDNCCLIILVSFLVVFFLLIFAYIIFKMGSSGKNKEIITDYPDEIKRYFYHDDGKNSKSEILKINYRGKYRICLYGATAIKGGRGGFQCGEHFLEKNDIIEFYLEGRNSGGKGGKNCGWFKSDAYDGAGLAKAIAKNNKNEIKFEIVAGGGGGDSDGGKSKGGDCGNNGQGKFGGKSVTGIRYYGGNGGRSGDLFSYCGGGGGNGYYGGGGGGYGKSKKDAGGGGGGSNYCNASNPNPPSINYESFYSGYKIYTNLKKLKP